MSVGMNEINNTAAPAGDLIKEGSTATFKTDVIDASMTTPVLVDFWAPWCGPCRQLTPALEKIVTENKGRVKLVKINVDQNQALSGQLGIQSIPTVFAFSGGRPADGFMGALPESELRRFVEKLLANAPAAGAEGPDSMDAEIAEALEVAGEAMAQQDYSRAAQIFGMVLQHVPDHAPALLGLARVYMEVGEIDRVQTVLDMVPEDARTSPDYLAIVAALKLSSEAAELGEAEQLQARIAANPDDHQARFDLAVVLNAEGQRTEAAEALIALIRRDRNWNEDGARKKLLEFFEAWGFKDPASQKGRRLLSAALFS